MSIVVESLCFQAFVYEPCNVERIKSTVKPVSSGHSKRRPKIDFQDRLLLNAGWKYCRMLLESILQYFWPSFTYHLSLSALFCLFLSGHFRQVLLYMKNKWIDGYHQINKGRSVKLWIFFYQSVKNMCFGCSKEPSQWDGSLEYPQHMFCLRNKKISLYKVCLSCCLKMHSFNITRFLFCMHCRYICLTCMLCMMNIRCCCCCFVW